MRLFTHFQKSIIVVMIFVQLTTTSGCVSTKIISTSDLPSPDSKNSPYVIHSSKKTFILEKSATINDGTLHGRIQKVYYGKMDFSGYHLYLTSDSVIKIDNGEFLSIPLNSIIKAEQQEVYGELLTGLVAAYLLGCMLLLLGFSTGLFTLNF